MKKTTGYNALKKRLGQILYIVHRKALVIVKETSENVANHARQDHGLTAHEQKRYINRSGDLTESIEAKVVKETKTIITGQVSANTTYASDVELGVQRSSRPYPYMFPALLASKAEFERRTQGILKE